VLTYNIQKILKGTDLTVDIILEGMKYTPRKIVRKTWSSDINARTITEVV
jgi:hypothetical protein